MTAKQQLLQYCQTHAMTPAGLVDLLQEYGLVSDNCVTFKDIAEVDARIAIDRLLTITV